MIKSKYLRKNSGLPSDDVEHTKEEFKKRYYKNVGLKPTPKIKPGEKPYPIPEEDSFIPPDDDSAEVKYKTKGKKS